MMWILLALFSTVLVVTAVLVDNQRKMYDEGVNSYRVKMYRVLLFAFWL